MCRLLGVIANNPINITFSFFKADTPFKKFSESNPDGWGIGWYENGNANIFKEGKDDSKRYAFEKVKEVSSKIIISHVRKSSEGDKTAKNAHPLEYNNWIFAHDGTVNRALLLRHLNENFKSNVRGDTDSEIYFLLIMQFFKEYGDMIEAIKKVSSIIKQRSYTGLNFLLSDGNKLYAFRNVHVGTNKERYMLFYSDRKFSKPSNYFSEKIRQMIAGKNIWDEKAFVFSSEKLTKGEKWTPINLGELIIIDENLNIKKTVL